MQTTGAISDVHYTKNNASYEKDSNIIDTTVGYENPIHELSGCGTDRTNTTSKSISKGSLDVFGTERSLHQRDKDLIGSNLDSDS